MIVGWRSMNSLIGAARNIITSTAITIAATMIGTCCASPTAVNTESSENTMSRMPICRITSRKLAVARASRCCSAPSSEPWISLTLLASRNRPPPNRIRSRPEISWSSTARLNSGWVRPISQVMENSSAMRVSIAKPRPRTRARGCCSFGSREARMDRKMMLSMPRTISRTVSVRNDSQACGS